MFDIWWNEINLTWLTILLAAAVALPLQLALCFKAKPLVLRLLPSLLS